MNIRQAVDLEESGKEFLSKRIENFVFSNEDSHFEFVSFFHVLHAC